MIVTEGHTKVPFESYFFWENLVSPDYIYRFTLAFPCLVIDKFLRTDIESHEPVSPVERSVWAIAHDPANFRTACEQLAEDCHDSP